MKYWISHKLVSYNVLILSGNSMSFLQQQCQFFWGIRWLRRSAISAIILLIILLLIPVIAQFTIIHLLEKQGADKASINDINVNLFAGTFELKELTFSKANSKPARIAYLSSNINMLDLFSSQIVISEAQVNGVDIEVRKNDNDELFLNGLPVVKESSTADVQPIKDSQESEPLKFALEKLELINITVYYDEPDFNRQGNISSLTLTNLKSWDTSSPANFNLEGRLNETPLSVTAELNLFDSIKQFKGTASLKSLGFGPYAKFYRQHVKTLEGNIELESTFDISLSENIQARLENNLKVSDLHAIYQAIDHRSENIEWQGVTELMADGQLSIQGDLAITGSETRDTKQDYQIAAFKQLALTNIKQSAKTIGFSQLLLDNLELIDLKDETSFVKIENTSLNNFAFNQNLAQLSIDKVELKKPAVHLEITEEKQLSFMLRLQNTLDELAPAPSESKTVDEPVDAAAEKPLSIAINKFMLIEPGVVDFTDNSVKPNYKTQISLDKVNLDNISSLEPAAFDLAIKQAEYTTFDIQGKGMLLDPTGNMELKAKIKQLDLPPVTPYTTNAMGYGMKSGVIDSDIDLKINKREIDSLIDLKIDSIEVVETNQETAEQVSSASGMSIDLAISTLKDKNNVIELKLPVKGNLDQPDFDLSLIINKAMGKAMKSASLSYLKHALQPFGSLVTLFSLVKAAADHISLPPILFNTNSLELKDDQQELLDKILKVLDERPGLKIKACGISALTDQEAIHAELVAAEKERLQEIAQKEAKDKSSGTKVAEKPPAEIVIAEALIQQKMRDLADQRAAKVKGFFLDQGKLDSNRILNCLSASNTKKDSKPSVEMQL